MRNAVFLLAVIGASVIFFGLSPNAYAKKDPTPKGPPKNDETAPADDKSASDNPYGATSTDESPQIKETPPEEESASPEAPAAEGGSLRRSNRLEFDERLIKGQVAKSGAVYLFERMPRHLPGLVPMRRSYRARIVQPVLGGRTLQPIKRAEEVVTTSPPTKAAEGEGVEQMAPPQVTPNANGKAGAKTNLAKPQEKDKKRTKQGKHK